MLAAGAAWLGSMAITLANPRRRRQFFANVAKSQKESAAREAERVKRARAEDLARKARRAEEKAEKQRRYDAEFIDRTLRVTKPYPDALKVTRTGGWGGAVGFYNRSEIADASINAFWSHWDARGNFEARIGKEFVAGEFYDRDGYGIAPGGEFVGTANDFLTEEQVAVILRLLGGEGGPDEVTFHRIKRPLSESSASPSRDRKGKGAKKSWRTDREELNRYNEFFAYGAPGDLLYRQQKGRTYPTREPFPDTEYSDWREPITRHLRRWESKLAKASFILEGDEYSNRTSWKLQIENERTMYGEANGLCLIGPVAFGPMEEKHRDIILRLLGGPGSVKSVTFSPGGDDPALRERIWAEHRRD